ncbi:DUF4236 domain-containing protein [Streptomyces sp. NBC_01619]|uniref:DUF4236 domain-containing protein n=1 Tax=Streptomyces pratisoli TaxID=3139917 RepID=A0ACC6QRT0_9ACTN|nr:MULTISPECIES: DUF4236 domain-containing protein [unclassified Streptomyces]MCX4514882.1 DUF4236 domain-containing protein [Streptomyces sp. NBC_01619]
MSLYYHKRITIIPRLMHLHIGTHGWSLSLGTRRARVTRSSDGRSSASVRLPGGFSWRRSSRRH